MTHRNPARWPRWAAAAVLAACAPSVEHDGRSVTVLAASSLTEPFTELARRFERAHTGTRVELAFAGTPAAVEQVRAGAPFDVVATADPALLEELAVEGLAGRSRVFARNRLALVVAEGNPHRIGGVDDLAAPGVDVVVCAPEVPCGRLAARALASATAPVRPVSYEANVKAVLTRVLLGEVDAGLVYASDVGAAAGRVDGVDLPDADGLVVEYAIARLTRSEGDVAPAFADFVGSAEGRDVLRRGGFEAP